MKCLLFSVCCWSDLSSSEAKIDLTLNLSSLLMLDKASFVVVVVVIAVLVVVELLEIAIFNVGCCFGECAGEIELLPGESELSFNSFLIVELTLLHEWEKCEQDSSFICTLDFVLKSKAAWDFRLRAECVVRLEERLSVSATSGE